MHRPGVGFFALLLAIAMPMRARGQAEYDAEQEHPFSRVLLAGTVSTLGIGINTATNLGPKVDLRTFGDYTNINHSFAQSGFHIGLNIGMANFGAKADLYPLHRFPLRISPGYLFYNGDRIAANLRAETGATFTINNVQYASDDQHPVYGIGRLKLSGGGFMVTAGLGHFLSHSYKRLTFPFEAGVAFISTPVAQFNLYGEVCSMTNVRFCQPAAQFPTFATNLVAQVKTWNHEVAPYRIYPIFEGGVAYSFGLRRRGVY